MDWIAVSQDGEEWWTGLLWLRTGKSGELDCCGSGRGRVVDLIAVAQDGEEWWTGLLWLMTGKSSGLSSTRS